MSSSPRKIRNYGKALFNASVKYGDVQGIRDRFSLILDVYKTVPEFRFLLYSRRITIEDKIKTINATLKNLASPFELDFIAILLQDGEIHYMVKILHIFFRYVERESDSVNVRITTASPLEKEMETHIVNSIAGKLNKKIIPSRRVDSRLIGGLTLRIGNTVIDGSVIRRLEKLKATLLRA